MNRYEQARAWLSDQVGIKGLREARDRMRELLTQSPIDPDLVEPIRVSAMVERSVTDLRLSNHRTLRTIATVDVANDGRIHEHVSVSTHHRLGMRAELATWDELVAVRSIAWEDDIEVQQVLPALTGPLADVYVNRAEVLHLRRIR